MHIGICAAPDAIAGLPELAFDFIEGNVQALLLPEADAAAFAPPRTALQASRRPMPAANCFLPADLKVTGPSPDLDRLQRYAETAFRRAHECGIETIVFGSGGARRVPEGFSTSAGFEQYIEALCVLGPIAQRHSVTLVVEPLNGTECNIVNTIDQGAEAVRRTGHPHVKLLVDVYHMLMNGESPDPIERHADVIVHAHVAEKQDRRQPGGHGEDFTSYFKALRKARACTRLAIECRWEPAMPAAVDVAVATLRRQLAAAGY